MTKGKGKKIDGANLPATPFVPALPVLASMPDELKRAIQANDLDQVLVRGIDWLALITGRQIVPVPVWVPSGHGSFETVVQVQIQRLPPPTLPQAPTQAPPPAEPAP